MIIQQPDHIVDLYNHVVNLTISPLVYVSICGEFKGLSGSIGKLVRVTHNTLGWSGKLFYVQSHSRLCEVI
jgi:hypothetical protein